MPSAGDKALTGAASGAAAGASLGPWGALVGGVVGGAAGYFQGDDPTAPNYQPGAPPSIPGGVSGQYGGMYYDPTTGSTQNLSYNFDPTTMGNQIQNQSLYNQLMGQGNSGMTNNLDFQAKTIQQQLARLQAQNTGGTGIGSQKSLTDAMGPGAKLWTTPDGKPIDPTDRAALKENTGLQQAFNAATAGHHGTYGNGGDDFYRWVQDEYKKVSPKIESWKQSQDVNTGNTDQRTQAIQSLQNQLDYINQAKTQAATGQDPNNPMMNFLNQRNQAPGGGDYTGKFVDPMQAQIAAAAQAQLTKSGVNTNTTLGQTPGQLGVPDAKSLTAQELANYNQQKDKLGGTKIANTGPYTPNPLAPDSKAATAQELANFNNLKGGLGGTLMDKVAPYDPNNPNGAGNGQANLLASLSGQLGGERMAPMGAYDPGKVGQFVESLNRKAQNAAVSNQAYGQEMAARRGVLGGSAGEQDRLVQAQQLQDSLMGNAATGYTLGQTDKNNWDQLKYQIDAHNSDVAKTGAQAQLSYGQQGFQNAQNAQKQWFDQNFGVNQFNSGVVQQGAQNQISGLNNILNTGVTNDLNAANFDQAGRQQNFANNFNIDQHNSEVDRLGSQANVSGLNSILQGGFGNEMTAQDFYQKLLQQGFTNNANTQQQAFSNAMGAATTQSQMGQQTLNNQNYQQGLDRQNFTDRMGLAQMLQGQTQQGTANQMNQIQLTNSQAGIGNQMGQFNANNQNQYNAATAAGQNAQNMGQWQGQINSNASQQQAFGQAAQGLGNAFGSYYGSQPEPSTYNPPNPSASLSGLPTGSNTPNPSLFSPPTPAPAPPVWVNPGQTTARGY